MKDLKSAKVRTTVRLSGRAGKSEGARGFQAQFRATRHAVTRPNWAVGYWDGADGYTIQPLLRWVLVQVILVAGWKTSRE